MKRLIGITLPDFFPGESEIIRCLFDAGLERLHLRKPGSEKGAFIALLKKIPAVYYPRIVLHDHFDVVSGKAISFRAGGLHLNRRNPSIPAVYTGPVSRSCHSFEEVKLALQEVGKASETISAGFAERLDATAPSGAIKPSVAPDKEKPLSYEYVFLSPLFPSISKEGYGSGFSLSALREAAGRGELGEKVIALGGLSVETIPLLKDLPFGGVAVLGGLWGEQPGLTKLDEIINRYKQLQTCLV